MRELFWLLRFRFYFFDQWFIPFCSDDFSRQYKRWCKRVLSLFLINSSSRPSSTWGEHIQFLDRCFLGNHFFIIYSFLLDQLILEASNWMFNSCSNICNCFLRFVQLTVQGISSLADIKVFGTHSIFSSTHLFYFFLNITRQNPNNLPLCYSSIIESLLYNVCKSSKWIILHCSGIKFIRKSEPVTSHSALSLQNQCFL